MKALEALHTIKNTPTTYGGQSSNVYTRCCTECLRVGKALRVLDILKKEVIPSVGILLIKKIEEQDLSQTYWEYKLYIGSIDKEIPITKRTYELLKEELEEDEKN